MDKIEAKDEGLTQEEKLQEKAEEVDGFIKRLPAVVEKEKEEAQSISTSKKDV